MKNNEIAVGLDIGTTKIVALVGQKNEFNKVEILGVGKSKSLGVHRGVVNNITQTIQSIQQAVLEAKTSSDNEFEEVVVGIAGQHIRSIQHSDYITRENADEVINEDDIQKLIQQVYKLVMLPGEEIIHVLPQEYKVDGVGEIKEPIGMYGGRLEANFHVVVGQIASIRNIGTQHFKNIYAGHGTSAKRGMENTKRAPERGQRIEGGDTVRIGGTQSNAAGGRRSPRIARRSVGAIE